MKHLNYGKYINITFPVFGLDNTPEDVRLSSGPCYLIINNMLKQFDDRSLSDKQYLHRLIKLENRIEFNFTILNMQQLIHTPTKFIIDNLGIPHDLSSKNIFKGQCKRIIKKIDEYIWVQGISYPFKLENYLNEIFKKDDLYVTIVRIGIQWYIYKFHPIYEEKNNIIL